MRQSGFVQRGLRAAAIGVAAFVLVVLGAALRPLIIGESQTAAPILTPVEAGFAQDMTAHHQQVLLMVGRLDHGVNANVLRLAQQLDDTQRIEIGTMLGWLRLANTAPMSSHPMAWMRTDSPTPHEHSMPGMPASTTQAASSTTMPGMATMTELDTLAAAHGRDAEILFLQLMLRHHQGGLVMAETVDQLLTSGAVKEAARSMISEQGQELGVMSVMLNQLGGQPLS